MKNLEYQIDNKLVEIFKLIYRSENSIKNPKVSYSSITDVIRLLLGGVKGNRKVNEREEG